jgi:PAS domain S-box-containing protein
MFGYTKDDVSNVEEWYKLAYPNKHFRKLVRERWNEIKTIAKKNNTHPPVEYPVVCKDGKTKIIDFKIASTGKLNFIVFTDITEKKNSEKSLKTRLERINLLNSLNLNLQEAFELSEIINLSYQIIPKYLNVDRIGIFLYSKELDGLISEKYIGKTISKEIEDFQPISIGISGKCFREKKIIAIENCLQTDIIPKRFADQLNLKSTVAIPLKALGECIGVIRLDYTNSYHYFLNEELEFYELLGLQLGTIIRNAQSYSEQQIISKELKESNERYYLTLDASELGIWDWNVETNDVFYSPQWKRQIGYEEQELKNEFETWVEHLHPDEREQCIQAVQNYLQNPVKHFILEFRFRHKDGSYRWIYNKASSIIDENGKVIRMFGAHTDITEQKLAQLAILDSEKQFKTLFDKAADAIFIADMESGCIIDANDAASKLMQLPKEKLIGLHQSKLHPDYLSENVENSFERHVKETTESNSSTPLETQVIRSDGNTVYVEVLASQIYYKGKQCLMGTFRDISERKKAEKELAHSYDLLKYVIENTQSSIAVHDTNMNYVYVSDRYYKDLKITEKNIIGKNHYEVFPDLPQSLRDVHQRALKGEVLSAENDMLVHKDGSIDYANWQCRPWYKADNSIGGIIIYIEVLTERRKAEFELRKSEKKLRSFLETSIEGVCAADYDDKITYVNPRMTELLGYSSDELLDKYFTDLLFPEDLSYYQTNQKLRKKGESSIFELKLRSKSGKAIWFLISASPIFDDDGKLTGSFGMFTDITEKKFAEDKIKSSEQRFRSIWENSFDAMRLTNSNGIIVE